MTESTKRNSYMGLCSLPLPVSLKTGYSKTHVLILMINYVTDKSTVDNERRLYSARTICPRSGASSGNTPPQEEKIQVAIVQRLWENSYREIILLV